MTEQPGENRCTLAEAARIGRGRIMSLHDAAWSEYDALLIPGGIGLIVNCCGSDAVRACVESFNGKKKAIGTMYAGIDFLRGILDSNLLQEKDSVLGAAEYCHAPTSNVFYTILK